MNAPSRPVGRPRGPLTVTLPVRVPLALVERVDALADILEESRAATIRRVIGWLPPADREHAA